MVEAEVEYDYDAVNSDELTLRRGDIITNILKQDGGWWEGQVHGKRGMFPDNFVKLLDNRDNLEKRDAAASMKSKSQAPGPPMANGETASPSSTQAVTKREGASNKRKLRAKVAYSYNPQNEDELMLIVNDEIEVVNQPEEGWWEGIINGKQGMFPSNFVTVIENEEVKGTPKPEAASATNATPDSGGTTPSEEEKPAKKLPKTPGAGFGNIFQAGQIHLKKTPTQNKDVGPAKPLTKPHELKRLSLKRDVPVVDKVVAEEKKDKEKPEKKDLTEEPAKGILKAKVIYDYDPKNPDELQLTKGTIITVVNKDAGDSGWWRGEINGKVGVFPDNFVEIIPNETEKKPPARVPARPTSGPTRPGSSGEPKPTQPAKPPIAKQQSQDTPKTALKEPATNGPARHLPAGAKQVLPPPGPPGPPGKRPPKHVKPVPSKTKPVDGVEPGKDSTDSGKQEPQLDSTFDDIKPVTDKLTHLNLSRPSPAVNRRPPSTIGGPGIQVSSSSSPHGISPLVNSSSDSIDGPSTTHPPPNSEEKTTAPPWSRDIKKSLRKPPLQLPLQSPSQEKTTENGGSSGPPGRPKISPLQAQSSPVSPAQTKTEPAPTPSSHPPPTRPPAINSHDATTPTPTSSGDSSNVQVQELRKEVQELRKENKALQSQMKTMQDQMRTEFKKEVKKLMTEVDEEKKNRMMMQVELERIRKLVMDRD